MKKAFISILSLILVFCTFYSSAQAPRKFNYQGIARDVKGNPLSEQTMSVKLSILPAADGMAEYEETQTVKTNVFGLYNLQIGNGTPLKGTMKDIRWETGNKYIKVGIDPEGGERYTDAGTTQLLSVPYAIYADKAGTTDEAGKTRTGTVASNASHVAADVNYLTKFTGLNIIGKSLLFDNGNSIGLGTAAPAAGVKLHIRANGSTEYVRMQQDDPAGFGKFLMQSDIAGHYATFTKYNSAATGAALGTNMATLYPNSDLLAFGNNNGGFLLSNNGNVGIGIVSGGTNLKFNAVQATGYLGLGGNAIPSAKVHFNTAVANDTIKFTNSTTGHLTGDGTEIRTSGNNTRIVNRENAALILGTGNADRVTIDGSGRVGIGTNSPSAALHVNGRIYAPGHVVQTVVMTSAATASANWNTFQEVDSNYRITITPAFANSILLIEYSFFVNNAMNANTIYQMQLIRDIPGTAVPVGVGPVNSLRHPVSFVGRPGNGFDYNDVSPVNMVGRDVVLQAGTPVTYGFKYRQETGGAGTAYFNYSFGDSDVYGWSGLVTMKITEIAQ